MKDEFGRDVAQGRKSAVRELAEGIHVMTSYDLKDFITPTSKPIVSLYIPIHRTEREGRRDEWDRIEFKDLIKQAKDELLAKYDKKDVEVLIERMDYILEDEDLPLWIDASAGLGFLMSATDTYVINMSYGHKPIVVVGDEYCLKPLIKNMQYLMHYKLLLLSTDFFSVLDGNYNGVHFEVMPDGVKEYFAQEYKEFDGCDTPLDYYSLEDHMSPFHGWKSRNDVTKEEAEKFFRYVAKELSDTVLRDDETPVILVTLPEHEHMFREVAHLRHLLPEAILKDPATMSGAELRADAVKIMEGIQVKWAAELCDKYNEAAAHGKGSANLGDIKFALEERKIEYLVVKGDKDSAACSDEMMNLVRGVLLQDGYICVLPAEKMPVDAPAVAIYRYAE